jgi:hypothetical protein
MMHGNMEINMYMKYMFTDKYKKQEGNPFTENSKNWHVWIDIAISNSENDKDLNIDKMMKYTELDYEYYDETLNDFVDMGYLECVYFNEQAIKEIYKNIFKKVGISYE